MIYPDHVGSFLFFTVTPRRLVPVPTLDRSSSSRPYSTTTCLLKYIKPLCVVKRKCYLLCKYCNEFCPDWFHSTSKVVRIFFFSHYFWAADIFQSFLCPALFKELAAFVSQQLREMNCQFDLLLVGFCGCKIYFGKLS